MVFEPAIFDYLEDDYTELERNPLERLMDDGQLMSDIHRDFWQCIDNVREKDMLEKLISAGKTTWIKW